jgi:hypothetical protein
MAAIYKEVLIEAPPGEVWAAVRDIGAVHERLAPGLVTDARVEGVARVVTFAGGMVARELVVSLDDELRRFSYAAVGGRAAHHSWAVTSHGTPRRYARSGTRSPRRKGRRTNREWPDTV